jgi:mono/diheme cytochrome c family protein
MDEREIEQVLDYLIFLSLRGETELALIDEAAASGELGKEAVTDVSNQVFNKWRQAESQVLNPPVPKPPSTRESVLRGKELFLALNKTGNRVDCTSCHGPQAEGNGPTFVNADLTQEMFNDIVFGGDPSGQGQRVDEIARRVETETTARTKDPEAGKAAAFRFREAWKKTLDEWGMPLRPANLNRGVYKGGRRPIDLYWRIAKGINGAQMPAHSPTLEPEKIWDLVNFVLELPLDKTLLEGATLPTAPVAPLPPPKVAGR